MESKKLLTSDVARILDCSTDNVRFLERSGKLPADKTAGGWRVFDRTSVEQFARDRATRLEIRRRRR
jgi:DNA-binding transcriptional MerR regulator